MQQVNTPVSQMPNVQAMQATNHPLLSRLIKEMQEAPELLAMPSSHNRYDRTYNRHNRGQ